MKYSAKSQRGTEHKTDCIVVGVYESKELSIAARTIDRASDGAIRNVVDSGEFDGRAGSVLVLRNLPGVASPRVMLVGFGPSAKLGPRTYSKAIAATTKKLTGLRLDNAALCIAELNMKGRDITAKAKIIAETVADATYSFNQLKSKNDNAGSTLQSIVVLIAQSRHLPAARTGLRQGQAVGNGVRLAKDLGNLPGNICTPAYLAKQARGLQRSHGLKVSVLDEAQMEKLGMGSLLSVSMGSREPAKLIVMEYQGGRKGAAPIAMVGKGLTFDAGGISLKPPAKMDEMKYDMCGAASVFGTMIAVAELKLPINVVGVVPSSENLPDGAANKPGDIVTSMSGKTIEILNTDAEGRLILCDALTYTERFKPESVIDIATLTGACVVALGSHASGLFCNDSGLTKAVLDAGERSRDRAWHMPMWDEYQGQLDSNFADMANVGGRDAGAVTAACFLSRYTAKFSWAHLDVAGTAWRSGSNKGATGRPVPLLTQFLIDRVERTRRR